LEQRPRDRVPLNWATAQNSLGSAFWSMGERESGTTHLEEAVAALDCQSRPSEGPLS